MATTDAADAADKQKDKVSATPGDDGDDGAAANASGTAAPEEASSPGGKPPGTRPGTGTGTGTTSTPPSSASGGESDSSAVTVVVVLVVLLVIGAVVAIATGARLRRQQAADGLTQDPHGFDADGSEDGGHRAGTFVSAPPAPTGLAGVKGCASTAQPNGNDVSAVPATAQRNPAHAVEAGNEYASPADLLGVLDADSKLARTISAGHTQQDADNYLQVGATASGRRALAQNTSPHTYEYQQAAQVRSPPAEYEYQEAAAQHIAAAKGPRPSLVYQEAGGAASKSPLSPTLQELDGYLVPSPTSTNNPANALSCAPGAPDYAEPDQNQAGEYVEPNQSGAGGFGFGPDYAEPETPRTEGDYGFVGMDL